MKITKVNFYPYSKKGNFKGYASVELGGEVVITGIRLLDGKKGLFIAMPAQADSEGEYHDIAFPVTKELREKMTDAVIEAYEDGDEKPKKAKKSKKRKAKDEDEDEDDEDDQIPF